MAERLIQEGMRWRADILPPAPRAHARQRRRLPVQVRVRVAARNARYSPATCFFMAMTSLSSSMHASSVISMPQLAWIAGSFAHVTLSPLRAHRFVSTAGRSKGAGAS